MIPLTDEDLMIFGKHAGKKMGSLSPSYLLWLGDQKWIGKWAEVKAYIEKNRTTLEIQIEDEREDWIDAFEADIY